MAQNTYKLGNGSNPISVTVVVSTSGSAGSELYKNANGSSSEVTTSTDATGVIPKVDVGTTDTLGGTMLEIDTDIELDFIPSNEWPACFDNLVIKYYVEGGTDGHKVFVCDDDDKSKSTSGKTITVEKFIVLS